MLSRFHPPPLRMAVHPKSTDVSTFPRMKVAAWGCGRNVDILEFRTIRNFCMSNQLYLEGCLAWWLVLEASETLGDSTTDGMD